MESHAVWKAKRALLAAGYKKARATIRQQVWDVELQRHTSEMSKHLAIGDNGRGFSPARYLTKLQIPKYRRAFTLARFNVLPSALLQGRFAGKPYAERLCPCGLPEVESVTHVLLRCRFYNDIRRVFISPVMQNPLNEFLCLKCLVEDRDPEITLKVAKYCVAAMRLREQAVLSL